MSEQCSWSKQRQAERHGEPHPLGNRACQNTTDRVCVPLVLNAIVACLLLHHQISSPANAHGKGNYAMMDSISRHHGFGRLLFPRMPCPETLAALMLANPDEVMVVVVVVSVVVS